jgi:hypothetical protein
MMAAMYFGEIAMEEMNKEIWTEMFEEIGLDHATMMKWHATFERRAPNAHKSFLEWLGVPTDEIAEIRAKSRS